MLIDGMWLIQDAILEWFSVIIGGMEVFLCSFRQKYPL